LRGKKQNSINPQFIIDNKKVTDRRVIANEFNKYFTSIASKLNDNVNMAGIQISPIPQFHEYLPKQEVSKIIRELQNGKSSDFPIHIIKKHLVL